MANISYWAIFAPVKTMVPINIAKENGLRDTGCGGPAPELPITSSGALPEHPKRFSQTVVPGVWMST